MRGVREDAVRAAFGVDVDGFDRGQRFRVPHRDRFAAGETVAGFGVDRRAICANIGNLTDGRKRAEVEDSYPGGGRVVPLHGAARNI